MIVSALADEAAPGWRTSVVGLCTVFALVGGQLAWSLRPYLVRPRAQDVVFVHEIEGNLFDAIANDVNSAQGNYRDEGSR